MLTWQLVQHYYSTLIANGVDGGQYPFERCWRDYRFNLWRALLSLCAIAPGLKEQFRAKRGVFAPDAQMTDNDRKTKQIYEQLNKRCVTALQDHKWFELLLEESEASCGVCSGFTLCY